MPTSIGNLISQDKYGRIVSRIEGEYGQKGYKVYADIEEYPKPPIIGGYKPDVLANKKGHRTIVAVETRDSSSTLHAASKNAAFRRASRRSSVTHYRRVIAW